MNLYKKANQLLVKSKLRKPITFGGNEDFVRTYRKGDISETNLFNVTCDGAYHPCERVEEKDLVLLGIDGKRKYSGRGYSIFARNFIPTPIFFRKDLGDKDIMYFHPSRMEWEKVGNIASKDRYVRLGELSESLE
ncbi:MAG: hypothetical protein ABH811_01615 [archaeon]